ncbi:MAG TPA: 3-oxo-5-alpha-steroid 4-dehydrogenase [Gemmatimonadales bacterium]
MTPGFEALVWLWVAIGAVTFLVLLKVPAPYGRHASPKWGPTVDNRVGWLVMELVVLVVFWTVIARRDGPLVGPELVMALLFTLHYANRALVFPFRLRTPGKRMPVVIMLLAVGFNLVNGSLLGAQLAGRRDYPPEWFTDPRFVIGLALFAGGMAVNWWADRRLIALRKPGETGYLIPRGGLFERVSCPNHLGEIVEWSGFALMTWSLPGFAFAFWTAANLVPRALAHHRWYQGAFPDYPARRKAVIPGLL